MFDANRATAFSSTSAGPQYHWAQIVRIASISTAAKKLTFEDTVAISMTGWDNDGDPRLRPVNMIKQVGIERLSVIRDRQPRIVLNNVDQVDNSVANVGFRFTDKAHADSIESSWLGRAGIELAASYDTSIKNNNIHDAFAYGGGGQAYGVYALNGTTRCSISNNKVWNMRHHIILALGANHCVVGYNSAEAGFNGSTGDLNIHGFSAHHNLFEGNLGATIKWDERSEPNVREQQGVNNTGYRNYMNRYSNSANRVWLQGPNQPGNRTHYGSTIIGNVANLLEIPSDVVRIVGANIWGGNYSGGYYTSPPANLPPSLYRTTKPDYFASSDAWPLFGPGVPSYGRSNSNPASRRSR